MLAYLLTILNRKSPNLHKHNLYIQQRDKEVWAFLLYLLVYEYKESVESSSKVHLLYTHCIHYIRPQIYSIHIFGLLPAMLLLFYNIGGCGSLEPKLMGRLRRRWFGRLHQEVLNELKLQLSLKRSLKISFIIFKTT